jgi:hypothetical protein
MIIKKIFDGNIDKSVHIAFLKFGRGEYKNKYLIEGKKQLKGYAIKTSAEFVNYLVRWGLEHIKGEIKVKGVIISSSDLRNEIKFELKKVSNFRGIRKHIVDCNLDTSEILKLMDRHPKAFFALSFKKDDFMLKTKAKAPASSKPGKEKDGVAVADFVTIKTNNKNILGELFFGIGDFSQIRVSHDIKIKNIVYPTDLTGIKPADIREQAKRKGVLERKVVIDGQEKETTSVNFVI